MAKAETLRTGGFPSEFASVRRVGTRWFDVGLLDLPQFAQDLSMMVANGGFHLPRFSHRWNVADACLARPAIRHWYVRAVLVATQSMAVAG